MYLCLWSCLATFIGWTVLLLVLAVAFILSVEWLINPKGNVDPKHKAVLITGCDTGIGHALAEHLDNIGFLVFAGCLNTECTEATELQRTHPRLRLLQLDVTSDEQTQAAVTCVQRTLREDGDTVLWAVVNNAGIHIISDIELTPLNNFRSILEVNSLGTVRITKAFIPVLRANKGARVINITSVNGRVAFPFTAAYNMSKFANEAFTDNLRLEMQRFGILCSAIEVANFGGATAIINPARMKPLFAAIRRTLPDDVIKTYGANYIDAIPAMYDAIRADCSLSLSPVTEGLTAAIRSRSPKHRYIIAASFDDRFAIAAWVCGILPSAWMDRMLNRYFTGNYPKPETDRA